VGLSLFILYFIFFKWQCQPIVWYLKKATFPDWIQPIRVETKRLLLRHIPNGQPWVCLSAVGRSDTHTHTHRVCKLVLNASLHLLISGRSSCSTSFLTQHASKCCCSHVYRLLGPMQRTEHNVFHLTHSRIVKTSSRKDTNMGLKDLSRINVFQGGDKWRQKSPPTSRLNSATSDFIALLSRLQRIERNIKFIYKIRGEGFPSTQLFS
jgi:hypothetical protein